MTPEEATLLRSKQWLLRAKTIRPAISRAIGKAIGKSPSEIVFADERETERISAIFSTHVQVNKDIEFSDRAAAIRFVTSELSEITGPAFLLQHDFDESGAVLLNFAEAVAHVDTLLQCQYECFRLVSSDGNVGTCIIVQEGSAPHYPRYVSLWRSSQEHKAENITLA